MFRFSLQTALEVRKKQEKIRLKELAEKIAIEQEIKQTIAEIEEQTAYAERDVNSKKNDRLFTIGQLRHLTSFKKRKKLELADHSQRLELAKKRVEEKRNNLVQASRARKTLEILRDREERRYSEKNARIERKQEDEIAGNQFFLNRGSL